MNANEAYTIWNSVNKKDMRVHSNEQMFAYGFDMATRWNSELVADMLKTIEDLEELVKRLSEPRGTHPKGKKVERPS